MHINVPNYEDIIKKTNIIIIRFIMLELVEKMHLVTGPFLFRTGKHPKMFGMIYGWFRRHGTADV